MEKQYSLTSNTYFIVSIDFCYFVRVEEVEPIPITNFLASFRDTRNEQQPTTTPSISSSEPPLKRLKTSGRPNRGNSQSDQDLWDNLKKGEQVERSSHQEMKLQALKTSKY